MADPTDDQARFQRLWPDFNRRRRLQLAVLTATEFVVITAVTSYWFAGSPADPTDHWWLPAAIVLNVVVAGASVLVVPSSPWPPRRTDADGDRDGTPPLPRRLGRLAPLVPALVLMSGGLVLAAITLTWTPHDTDTADSDESPRCCRGPRVVVVTQAPEPRDTPDVWGPPGEVPAPGTETIPATGPILSETGAALAAQLAQTIVGTLFREGVNTGGELKSWLLDRAGAATDTFLSENLKRLTQWLWEGGDGSVTPDDVEAGEDGGTPPLCDGLAVEIRDVLDQRVRMIEEGASTTTDVAVYFRQSMCPGIALLEVSTTPREPEVPEVLPPHGPGGTTDTTGPGKPNDGRPLHVEVYVVRRGDSLWTIVSRLLPRANTAEVTQTWHSVWALNSALIGPNADVIEPGMRLKLEAALPSG